MPCAACVLRGGVAGDQERGKARSEARDQAGGCLPVCVAVECLTAVGETEYLRDEMNLKIGVIYPEYCLSTIIPIKVYEP